MDDASAGFRVADLLTVEVPATGRVLVASDLHLPAAGGSAATWVSRELSDVVDTWRGPGVLVLAGDVLGAVGIGRGGTPPGVCRASASRRLATGVRRGRGVPGGVSGRQPRRPPGRTISGARWPGGSVVVSIQRGPHLLFPEGDTVLEPGDVVSVLTRPEHAGPLRTCLRGPDAEAEEERRPGPGMI